MNLKSWILLLILFFLPLSSSAQDFDKLSLHVTIRSHHIGAQKDYNEWNLGFGLGYDVGSLDIEVGSYYNSQKRTSFYITGVKRYPEDYFIGGIVSLGIVTGYEENPINPFPVIGMYLNNNPRLRIGLLPDPETLVIFSQLRYSF